MLSSSALFATVKFELQLPISPLYTGKMILLQGNMNFFKELILLDFLHPEKHKPRQTHHASCLVS